MNDAAKTTLPVESWLLVGPGLAPLPVFHAEAPGGVGLGDLLGTPVPPPYPWSPLAGREEPRLGRGRPRWVSVSADTKGLVTLSIPPGAAAGRPASAWLATYLRAERFSALDFEVLGSHPARVWLDGQAVVTRLPEETGEKGKAEARPAKGRLKLTRGSHLLLMHTLAEPEPEASWTVGILLSGEKGAPAVSFSTRPERDLDIVDILDAPRITSVAVSPDGSLVACTLTRFHPGTSDAESWVEVRSSRDGSPVRSIRVGTDLGQVGWAPSGRRLTYLTRGKVPKAGGGEREVGTVWLMDLETGVTDPLLERVEDLSGYAWSPTGDGLAYWVSVKPEGEKRGIKRVEGLLDRMRDYRTKTYLHLLDHPGGASHRLTAGSLSAGSPSFSPDGSRLLFVREVEDSSRRPYSRKEIWEVDRRTFESKKLRDSWWLVSAQYAADGQRLVLVSGPSEFGAAGVNVPLGLTPNEGDGQLYLWDPSSDEVVAASRDFDPSIEWAWVSPFDRKVYVKATDREAVRIFRYDPEAARFEPIPAGVEVVGELSFATGASIAAFTGSSPWTPDLLSVVDLSAGASRVLARPADAWYAGVRRGTVEPWSFKSASGRTIAGQIYLPPDFDPTRKYPAIVNVYGGTAPITLDFAGRYPKEWWAAQGYVVYVLQPSGATGFGQAFSALHVNEWGSIVVDEVLEGTNRFLESHPYVDPARVGCIGASYGGFVTMLLVTKSDRFAAAVAHAGISQIASYWGEGYWGYSYNAQSAADSFPWNRRDLYVERSPLFRADRVKTPILLTHGASDTNVPVGESDAFFVALRLLNAPVEYLQVEGQDHWILDHDKRLLWSRSIVAWFDRHLKGEGEWWDDLYPKPK